MPLSWRTTLQSRPPSTGRTAQRVRCGHPERRVSQISALGVAAWYAQDRQMAPLVPVVLGLHLGYTPAKPLLAPVKPFFVAWWWTVCVYALPALHAHVENQASVLPVASFYLSLAALSHAVDVLDMEESIMLGFTLADPFNLFCLASSQQECR